MPYSFIEIEQSKSRSIYWSLAFLGALYIVGAIFIVGVVKYFFFYSSSDSFLYGRPAVFQLLDASTLLWTIGGAVLMSAAHWATSTYALIDRTLQYMSGRIADPADDVERVFCNVVEEAAVATGGKYRIEPYIIPIAALNAFALQDFQGRSVIGVTEGLLKRLNREQLESVVAHEAGHIASGDCLETTVTSVVFKSFDTICDISRRMLFYGNISGSQRSSSRKSGSGGQFAILLLIVFLISLLLKLIGNLGALFVSRQREYRADALAVRLTRNPLALAEALHIIDQRWKGSGMPGEAMDAIFILNPRQNAVDDHEDLFANLFSTHPPIKSRIGILLDMAHAKAEDLNKALVKAQQRFTSLHQEPETAVQTKEFKDIPGMSTPLPVPVPVPVPVMLGVPEMPSKKDLCPRCREALTMEKYEGVEIMKCSLCQGALVKEMNVLHIVGTKEVHFSERIVDMARITREQVRVMKSNPFDSIYDQKSIVCPSCLDAEQRMTRRFINSKYPVEVDKCKLCARVWFDRDELELLQCLYEKDQSAIAKK